MLKELMLEELKFKLKRLWYRLDYKFNLTRTTRIINDTSKFCDACRRPIEEHPEYDDETGKLVRDGYYHKYYDGAFEEYKRIMRMVLKQFGVNKPELFFENACYGNWKHLWENEEEKQYTFDKWFDMLIGELFCNSDRWSWDRIIRTQWIYMRCQAAVEQGHTW